MQGDPAADVTSPCSCSLARYSLGFASVGLSLAAFALHLQRKERASEKAAQRVLTAILADPNALDRRATLRPSLSRQPELPRDKAAPASRIALASAPPTEPARAPSTPSDVAPSRAEVCEDAAQAHDDSQRADGSTFLGHEFESVADSDGLVGEIMQAGLVAPSPADPGADAAQAHDGFQRANGCVDLGPRGFGSDSDSDDVLPGAETAESPDDLAAVHDLVDQLGTVADGRLRVLSFDCYGRGAPTGPFVSN